MQKSINAILLRLTQFLLLFTLLTACDFPANVAADAINRVAHGDDSATLTLERVPAGFVLLTFDPGLEDAESVTVYIGGEGLAVDERSADVCGVVRSGIGCALGDVAEDTMYAIYISGRDVTGNVRYYRPASDIPKLIVF